MHNENPWPRTSIRGIDPALWDRIRVAAVRHHLPVGEVVNAAFSLYLRAAELHEQRTPPAQTTEERPQ